MYIQVIYFDDKEYPENLKKYKKAPQKLFCQGNIALLNSLCFSVVGSRALTPYGKRIEKKFVRELTLRGITIVSGMAIGSDTVAHTEALENGGNTIAVLPCGFEHIYPKENINLYHRILENNGLVITEYKSGAHAESQKFLYRNRIVSGLSEGVLIIEAKIRSGTSVTAKYAKEQGRKVFALPGRLDSKNGIGVNNLIKRGAIMVTSVNDIIDEISKFQSLVKQIPKRNYVIKKEYRKIYSLLNDEPLCIDEICQKTNNTVPATLNLLSLMELDDLIEEIVGMGYVRKFKE